MLVLDTDLLTLVQRKTSPAYERLQQRLDTEHTRHTIRVTIISYEEQMRGWLALIKKAQKSADRIRAYDRFMSLFEDYQTRQVLRFDDAASAIFDSLVRRRIRVGTMDLRIAAVVLSRNATLLSRNLKDLEKVPDLRVKDWTL